MNINEIVITDVTDVMTVFLQKNRFNTMTNRKCYGLSFTNDGQITYTQNGKTYVSDKNNVIILPKGQNYTLHGDKEGHFPLINFEAENISETEITLIPIKNSESIYKDFEHIKKLYTFKKQRLMGMSILYNILNTLSRDSLSLHTPLQAAVEYMEKNFSYDVTNRQLADMCHFNEEYFRKLFKKTYGISPKQYIINIRITKAKQLLKEGVLKIGSVSEMCGFSNQYHFCRFFKQKTGMTPTQYMNENNFYNPPKL